MQDKRLAFSSFEDALGTYRISFLPVSEEDVGQRDAAITNVQNPKDCS